MSDVNLQLVREFFELNLFRVLTNWQQDPRILAHGDQAGQLFVDNSNAATPRPLPFVLRPDDLACIERAVVEIRAWHTDRFYPSVIESNPILTEFVSEDSLALAREVFQQQSFATILVISELPASAEQRNRSIELLEKSPVDHVIEFPHLLHDLLQKVNVSGSYPDSQTLEMLRLLKRYKLTRNQQLEFAFATEAPVAAVPPVVETIVASAEDAEASD
ncbi:MAG: hypothetical protein DHS20C16_36390 [Phycisphaerae bacterium]|nr:MAG: hypothetical protein DHS20C16_36390 [Phycisphaerae bacterium]